MLISPFKSRPKSDRRQEWKALKASHAKELAAQKLNVEIGLGKALDEMERQVAKAVALPAEKLTPAALAPLVRSALEVKRHAATLGPKLKPFDKLNKFMLALKLDIAWWEKTAREINQGPGLLTPKEAKLVEFIGIVLKLPRPMDLLDKALKNADQKTGTYDPPDAVAAWAKSSKELRSQLAKLALLNKNAAGNIKLVAALMKQMQEPIRGAMTAAKSLEAIAKTNLPPVADWQAVSLAAPKCATDLNFALWGMGKLL